MRLCIYTPCWSMALSCWTRLLTLRSTERSPKSTTRPPWIAGLTFCTILSDFPPADAATFDDLSALSMRETADLSRGYGHTRREGAGDVSIERGQTKPRDTWPVNYTHDCAGDGDLHLTPVGVHELHEALDDLLGVVEAAVLGEDLEQVAGRVCEA